MNATSPDHRQGHLIPSLAILGVVAAAILFLVKWNRTVVVERIVEKPVIKERIVEKKVIEKPPLPSRSIAYDSARTRDDLAKLYNGIVVKSELSLSEGAYASLERKDDAAYQAEFKLTLRVPKPNESLEELASLNEHLPKVLPALEGMLGSAKVSGFYHKLYEMKTKRVQENLTRLRQVLSRHNYFDCETILEMVHPDSGRHVLLIQGEMDVVSDGSDGDRMPEYDDFIANSPYYRPFTSYGWAKRTAQPNPLLKRYEEKLADAEAALKKRDSADLRKTIKRLKAEISDLKARSYLIARKDPFVVIPLSFLGHQKQSPFAPTIGDYVAVIHQDKVYPAILGDAGPADKCGEASLRIAKTISEKASPYNRPVSDLTVTYVIFPQSRDSFGPPDLERWHAKCSGFLDEIGGLGDGYTLHRWEDLFKLEGETPAVGVDANESVIRDASP